MLHWLVMLIRPRVEDGKNNETEWGEFLHLPGEKFYDFTKIRSEIVRDTEAKTGKNAGVCANTDVGGPISLSATVLGLSPLPINLRIFSPNGGCLCPLSTWIVLMLLDSSHIDSCRLARTHQGTLPLDTVYHDAMKLTRISR